MYSVGQQMATQTNNLGSETADIYKQFSENSRKFNSNYSQYRKNNNKINNMEGVRVREGFASNPDKNINMIDINSMLNDTDIRVLQENYGYIFWSILAVGLLTITISKSNI